jgi:hypothetical protein
MGLSSTPLVTLQRQGSTSSENSSGWWHLFVVFSDITGLGPCFLPTCSLVPSHALSPNQNPTPRTPSPCWRMLFLTLTTRWCLFLSRCKYPRRRWSMTKENICVNRLGYRDPENKSHKPDMSDVFYLNFRPPPLIRRHNDINWQSQIV